jgi:hypothetical protein
MGGQHRYRGFRLGADAAGDLRDREHGHRLTVVARPGLQHFGQVRKDRFPFADDRGNGTSIAVGQAIEKRLVFRLVLGEGADRQTNEEGEEDREGFHQDIPCSI